MVSQGTLSDELLDNVGRFDISTVTSVDEGRKCEAWFTARIAATVAEIADEKASLPQRDWDIAWIQEARSAIKLANSHLNSIRGTVRQLMKHANIGRSDEHGSRVLKALNVVLRRRFGDKGFSEIYEEAYKVDPMIKLLEHPVAQERVV